MEEEVDLHDGVECTENHFYCDECFSKHIIMKSNEDQQAIKSRQGKVFCAGKCFSEAHTDIGGMPCHIEYTLKVIVSHGSQEAIDSYTRNIARLAAWEAEAEQIRISQRRLLEQQEEQANQDMINRTTKPCPQCGFRIQHPKGHACHHIKPGSGCPECGTHWCYACGSAYEPRSDPSGKVCSCTLFCTVDCDCPPCELCASGTPCDLCDQDGSCPHCENVNAVGNLQELLENEMQMLGNEG